VKGRSELRGELGRSEQYPERYWRKHLCDCCTRRGASVWMRCAMKSTVPEAGKSSQRLCSHVSHLYDVALQEQIIKQQSGEEPSPQRRQLKYDASSKVFLTIFEVFEKVLKQSLECLI